jgi:hypothetical protein
LVIAFGLLTGAFLLNADDITGNADKVHKLMVVSTSSSPLNYCPVTDQHELGRWSMHLCNVHGRLVHFLGSVTRVR